MEEFKKFCIKHVNNLGEKDRIEVLEFLMINHDVLQISDKGGDGTRVNLDKMNPQIIRTLYTKIKHKMET
jgi:hypothetical protein